jgi:hypothetical protein
VHLERVQGFSLAAPGRLKHYTLGAADFARGVRESLSTSVRPARHLAATTILDIGKCDTSDTAYCLEGGEPIIGDRQ